jgi:hypothetical protein
VRATERKSGRGFPLALLVASVVGSGLFVLGLGVATFLMRDVPLGGALPLRPALEGFPASSPEERLPPGFDERQSASTALAPLVPVCFAEAGARDPSLPEAVDIIATLDTRPGGGSIVAVRLGASSPFLAACLRKRLVGERFPAGADSYGEVRWRARVEAGRAVLEEQPG